MHIVLSKEDVEEIFKKVLSSDVALVGWGEDKIQIEVSPQSFFRLVKDFIPFSMTELRMIPETETGFVCGLKLDLPEPEEKAEQESPAPKKKDKQGKQTIKIGNEEILLEEGKI